MSYNDELFLWIHFNCNVSIFLDFYTIRANFLKLFSNTCVSTFLDSTYISISFPLGISHCASSIMASISYSWLWIRSLIWKEIGIKWETINRVSVVEIKREMMPIFCIHHYHCLYSYLCFVPTGAILEHYIFSHSLFHL